MPSSSETPEEILEVLKYLRDHNHIQGIGFIQVEKIRSALGWEETKLNLVLESCYDSGYIGPSVHSAIYITPGGLKALMRVNR